LLNGAGVLAYAGVNGIAGMGAAGTNAFISPWFGVVLAVVGIVAG